MTMMLKDPFFNNDEMIIDECNSFMIAANITTSMTLTNAIFYLCKYPQIKARLRDVINKEVL